MDLAELKELFPTLLESMYPGRISELLPDVPFWVITGEDSASLVCLLGDPVQVRITGGMAIGSAPAPNLYQSLNEINANIVTGRGFAMPGANGAVNVVLQDTFFGPTLCWDRPEPLEDLRFRISQMHGLSADYGRQIRGLYGGHPVTRATAGALLD